MEAEILAIRKVTGRFFSQAALGRPNDQFWRFGVRGWQFKLTLGDKSEEL